MRQIDKYLADFIKFFLKYKTIRVYTGFSLLGSISLSFYGALYPLFLEHNGIDYYEMGIIFAIMPISMFLFEIPTGILGDIIGRKNCLVLNAGISFVSKLLLVLFPQFVIIILCEILSAISLTFATGNLQAWLIDNSKKDGLDKPMIFYTSTLQTLSIIGISVGLFLAGLLGTFNLIYPMIVGTILSFFTFCYTILFLFDNYEKKHVKSFIDLLKKMKSQFIYSVIFTKRNTPTLYVFIIAFFVGFGTVSPFMSHWQQYFSTEFHYSPYNIGILSSSMTVLSFFILLLLPFFANKLKEEILLSIVVAFSGFFLITLSIFKNYYYNAILFLLAFLFHKTIYSISASIINREVDSDNRATILSTFSQCFTLGTFSGSLFCGFLCKFLSLKNIWIFCSISFLIGAVIAIIVLLKAKINSHIRFVTRKVHQDCFK